MELKMFYTDHLSYEYGVVYFVENSDIWYQYNDVAFAIQLEGDIVDNIYKTFFTDDEKRIVNVKNKYNEYEPRNFINSFGLHRLLDRNAKYINDFRQTVLSVEESEGIINNNDMYKVKRDLYEMQKIVTSNNIDYKQLEGCAKRLCKSHTLFNMVYTEPQMEEIDVCKEEMKNMLCKAVDDDALEEFKIDEYWLYEYYDEDVKMKPREKSNNSITYKRNRNVPSTCPSWLREVVK